MQGNFYGGKPWALTDPGYTEDLKETFNYGGKNSSRNQYQNETGYYWLDGTNSVCVTGHFYKIAEQVIPVDTPLLKASCLLLTRCAPPTALAVSSTCSPGRIGAVDVP